MGRHSTRNRSESTTLLRVESVGCFVSSYLQCLGQVPCCNRPMLQLEQNVTSNFCNTRVLTNRPLRWASFAMPTTIFVWSKRANALSLQPIACSGTNRSIYFIWISGNSPKLVISKSNRYIEIAILNLPTLYLRYRMTFFSRACFWSISYLFSLLCSLSCCRRKNAAASISVVFMNRRRRPV